ncbi:MAG: hypothetical protein KDA32_10940 [Phycisphaerales bacterium]|nr:hypothetical protein [Phycisphaerales bacterium]
MRARNIKPGFFKNEQLAELPVEARLLYIGLWCMADREGRLEDRPKRIKMEVFPADSFDCEPLLSGLEAEGLIVRYEIDGQSLIEIPRFLDHQSPHYTEKPSVLMPPALPEDSEKTPSSRAGDSGDLQKRYPLNPDSLIPDSLNPECSPLRENGCEPPKKGKSEPPDWSAIANLDLEWWQIWLAHRRAEKRPTYKTTRVAIALAEFPPAVQQAAIEQSMAKGWTGLFPEKINGSGLTTNAARTRFDEHRERLAEWYRDASSALAGNA